MSREVTWIPGGLVGWRLKKSDEDEKKSTREEGAIVAVRENGNEALFTPRTEEPCVWIQIGDFIVEPATIPEFEYVEEEPQGEGQGQDGGGLQEGPPQKDGPFGVRRRGGKKA